MEGSVNGFGKIYQDLSDGYLAGQKSSFLYKAFWCDNMEKLLEKHFPSLPAQELPAPDDEQGIRRLRMQMVKTMLKRPEWARALLLRSRSGKQRRNFWEELWLNDIGYRAGLITDTDFYLWLVRYLTAQTIYYRDNIYYYDECRDRARRPGHIWLYRLLMVGLGMTDDALKREIEAHKQGCKEARKEARKKGRKKPGAENRLPQETAEERASTEAAKAGLSRKDLEKLDFSEKELLSKEEVAEALAMLSEQIQADRNTIADRLHLLFCRVRSKDGSWVKTDYLAWLTEQLEWMALNVKIKTWLQDGGHPLRGDDEEKPSKIRRDDFTIHLFETYCSSPDGYVLQKKAGGAGGTAGGAQPDPAWEENGAVPGDWRLVNENTAFCVLHTDEQQLGKLLLAHGKTQADEPYLYLPLAVHLQSGCVFFLAGKAYYETVYENAEDELQQEYRNTKARYCFDYQRQNLSGYAEAGSFLLTASFHENAFDETAFDENALPEHVGKYYQKALADFKNYCAVITRGSPLHAIRKFNGVEPEGLPDAFRWAFDS